MRAGFRAAVFFAVFGFAAGDFAIRGAVALGDFTVARFVAGAFVVSVFFVVFFATIAAPPEPRTSMMRPSVRAGIRNFNAPFEGVVAWFYLCIRGLVTIAIGLLYDDPDGKSDPPRPPAAALALPLMHPSGRRATSAEIAAEWRKVKASQALRRAGGGAFRHVTTLRLTPESIEDLAARKAEDIARELARVFPAFPSWPADGQLATMSMVYALGLGRLLSLFPKLCAALRRLDFGTAAAECEITSKDDPKTPDDEANPGVIERNKANVVLFLNAAIIIAERMDPMPLYYPRDLALERRRAADTLRELTASPPSSSSSRGSRPAAGDVGPVLEDDGGASRRSATSAAVLEVARRRD